MKKYHFVSGLPRSGSTLLMNVLAQNPRFHSTHTSGCLDVIFATRNQWDSLIEHKAHPLPDKKRNVLRGILRSYHEDVPQDVIFDKSRGWLGHMEMVEEILGEPAKVLVCVRAIPDILSSFEKLYRDTSKIQQPPGEGQNYIQFQTVQGRCEHWFGGNNVVGLAYNRIIDAVRRGFRDRMYFVPFGKLTADPKKTMQGIYKFLGEDYFDHDFQNVEQVTEENDAMHGYLNLHKIQSEIKFKPSDAAAIIGKDMVEKYGNLSILEEG